MYIFFYVEVDIYVLVNGFQRENAYLILCIVIALSEMKLDVWMEE